MSQFSTLNQLATCREMISSDVHQDIYADEQVLSAKRPLRIDSAYRVSGWLLISILSIKDPLHPSPISGVFTTLSLQIGDVSNSEASI